MIIELDGPAGDEVKVDRALGRYGMEQVGEVGRSGSPGAVRRCFTLQGLSSAQRSKLIRSLERFGREGQGAIRIRQSSPRGGDE